MNTINLVPNHQSITRQGVTDQVAYSMSLSLETRYPKRKRQEISYADNLDDDFVLDEDDDYHEPAKKKVYGPKRSRKVAKSKTFPFMSLPAELRNKIYEFALSDEDGIFITSKTKGYRRLAQRCIEQECEPQFSRYRSWRRQRNDSEDEEGNGATQRNTFSPNLLAVSKALHAEASSFLYSQRIVVADNYALHSFVNQIGPRHSIMLRDITIKEWCGGRAHRSINFPAMTLIANAKNLQRLNIACAVGYFHSYSYRGGKSQDIGHRVARKIFRDCYPFLEAFGRQRGSIDAGIEILEIDEENFSGRSRVYGQNEVVKDSMKKNVETFRKELGRLLKT